MGCSEGTDGQSVNSRLTAESAAHSGTMRQDCEELQRHGVNRERERSWSDVYRMFYVPSGSCYINEPVSFDVSWAWLQPLRPGDNRISLLESNTA